MTFSRQPRRDLFYSFGSGYAFEITELLFQNMPEEKQQRIERQVLSRCCNLFLHGQMSDKRLGIRGFDQIRRFAFQKGLEQSSPPGVGAQRFSRILPYSDFVLQQLQLIFPALIFCKILFDHFILDRFIVVDFTGRRGFGHIVF